MLHFENNVPSAALMCTDNYLIYVKVTAEQCTGGQYVATVNMICTCVCICLSVSTFCVIVTW